MAINIHHTYCTHVYILYDYEEGNLHEDMCGEMDEIAEHVSEVLIKHNFTHADVCDKTTGELLMMIKRT